MQKRLSLFILGFESNFGLIHKPNFLFQVHLLVDDFPTRQLCVVLRHWLVIAKCAVNLIKAKKIEIMQNFHQAELYLNDDVRTRPKSRSYH